MTLHEQIELRRQRETVGMLHVGLGFGVVAALLFTLLHVMSGGIAMLVFAVFELGVAAFFGAHARRIGRRVRELEEIDR